MNFIVFPAVVAVYQGSYIGVLIPGGRSSFTSNTVELACDQWGLICKYEASNSTFHGELWGNMRKRAGHKVAKLTPTWRDHLWISCLQRGYFLMCNMTFEETSGENSTER